jgi:hypothetical protein
VASSTSAGWLACTPGRISQKPSVNFIERICLSLAGRAVIEALQHGALLIDVSVPWAVG